MGIELIEQAAACRKKAAEMRAPSANRRGRSLSQDLSGACATLAWNGAATGNADPEDFAAL